jgi:hypothetical protein
MWLNEDTLQVTYMLGRSGIRGLSSVMGSAMGIWKISFPFLRIGDWIVPRPLFSQLETFEKKLDERFALFMEKLSDEKILTPLIWRLCEKMKRKPEKVAEILGNLNAYLVKVKMNVVEMNSGAKMLLEWRYKRHIKRYISWCAKGIEKFLKTPKKRRKRAVKILEERLWKLTMVNQGKYLLNLQEALIQSLESVIEND